MSREYFGVIGSYRLDLAGGHGLLGRFAHYGHLSKFAAHFRVLIIVTSILADLTLELASQILIYSYIPQPT